MSRALDLASMAWPNCRPNPMVGAVLVHQGRIVSEGYTQGLGGPHAEVMCLRDVHDPQILAEAILYVTLEPCCHHGRTPPCTDLILEKGLKRVVVACPDPNELVAGKGLNLLEAGGVEVTVGLKQAEAEWMNRRFITAMEEKRPYIILKWAETADGFMDRLGEEREKALKITGPLSDQMNHLRRSQEMAILVGGETYRKDEPRLTVRHVDGEQPQRFVWSSSVQESAGWQVISGDTIHDVLSQLTALGVQSLMVEGGAKVLKECIEAGIFDEIHVFQSSDSIGKGVLAPKVSGDRVRMYRADVGRVFSS